MRMLVYAQIPRSVDVVAVVGTSVGFESEAVCSVVRDLHERAVQEADRALQRRGG